MTPAHQTAGGPSTNNKRTEWKRDAHVGCVYTRVFFCKYLPSRRYVLVVPFYAISVDYGHKRQKKSQAIIPRVKLLNTNCMKQHVLVAAIRGIAYKK